ncbi:SusC/RagA family TonB-linked outer membrane protein [Bacteroides faecalis]|nr:TonB-dependent receptor [Bacteroides faecalis]
MKKLLLILVCICMFTSAFAQSFVLKGMVSSTDGEFLPGVNVKVQNSTVGTITDVDGNFQLTVNKGAILEFTYVGFKKQSIKVDNQQTLNIVLAPDQTDLDEVVVVGYGKAKRLTLTGAVSGIKASEIRNVPTSSVQNALTGKLPGFFSQQKSGQPGKDASDFFIRGVSSLNGDGNKPLIIVDDMQYTYEQLAQINVNEIESISILKDASTTAVYGIKGANGVLVVTTRRGQEGKPKINVRLESGMQTPVRTPKFLNSYESLQLVKEAHTNDGTLSDFPYTDEDMIAFRDHTDPYGHPDVNWYNEIFKKMAFQENINVDVSGGSKRLRYFVSAGYFTQNGLVKDFGGDVGDGVNPNYFYRRFNYRTNIDFDVTDNFNMRLDVSSRFMNINEPYQLNVTGSIYDFKSMHPYSAPVLNPDGSYAYLYDTQDRKPTLNARLGNEGYRRTRRNDNNILYGATWKMDFLTKGLSANFRLAYGSRDENFRGVVRNRYPTYHYDSKTDTYTIHPDRVYDYEQYFVFNNTNVATKDLNVQASLDYAHVFNMIHDVNAMFLYNRQSTTNESGASVPNNFEGYSLKLGYKYKNKYLIDLNMGYNGTDRFGKDNRFGFFPAFGVGYIISEENYFKNVDWLVDNVQVLKLRASYGLVGSDVAGGDRYLYRQKYTEGDSYPFGEGNNHTSGGYKEGDLSNLNVTWEKAKKFDVGLEMNLFDKISFTVDYFIDKRYDQLVSRNDIPDILGIGISPTNVAKTTNQGFDGQLGFQDRYGDFNFNTNLVFSYAKNKVDFKAEAQQKYDWLRETGRPINQPFGYHWVGYYTPDDIAKINAGDVSAPATPEVPVQAGDLKYADLNNDGVINDFDKKAIGKPNLPTTTLGWSIGGYWKGFSFNVLFQGSFDYSFAINGTGIESGQSQFQPIHQKRWTQERFESGEPIEFPRMTLQGNTVNSATNYMSDFWLINAWYIRLKTIDLGYQLPKKVLPKFIDNIRFYINAYNLLTFTGYDKYQQDPEISTNTAGDAYMNQRVVNLGVQLSF